MEILLKKLLGIFRKSHKERGTNLGNGGDGGDVLVIAKKIIGNGKIIADGGDGSSGGRGGRVTLISEDNQFSGAVSAKGGRSLMENKEESLLKNIFIGIFVSVIAGLILYYGFGIGRTIPSQNINNSPNSINTIGQVGDNNINIGLVPRNLSDIQKSYLKEELAKNPGKIGFVSKIFDSESERFATELSKLFISAGWEVNPKVNKTLLDSFDGDIGIYADGNNPEIYARVDLLCNAFKNISMPCGQSPTRDGVISGNFLKDTIYIVVDS